jgi:hypothetical protein
MLEDVVTFQDDGSGGTGVHLTWCNRVDFLGDACLLAFVGVWPLQLDVPFTLPLLLLLIPFPMS